MGGIEHIWILPGSKVLYLGAASGTSVSHVADIVGPVGITIIKMYFSFYDGLQIDICAH